MNWDAVFIAGPTASGKSALSLAIARTVPSVIINADSMQVYSDLRILSARPSHEDEAVADHVLYGHIDGAEEYNTAEWVSEASAAIEAAKNDGKLPIVIGGTGLYFTALTVGLAKIPEIKPEIRADIRDELQDKGAPHLHQILFGEDPKMAERLNPNDGQRIARALEVIRSTGRSLASFQTDTKPGPMGASMKAGKIPSFVIDWPREYLYERCNKRFEWMLSFDESFDEVRCLMERNLPAEQPVLKALGVPSIAAYLSGEISREEAIDDAQMQTRRFAKRQMTWFRNQFPDWHRISGEQVASIPDFANGDALFSWLRQATG